MLNQLVNTIIGASVIARERIEDELKVLESKGKINKSDVNNLIKSLEKKGKKENKKVKKQIRLMIKEIINELGLATKEDLKNLENKLKEVK